MASNEYPFVPLRWTRMSPAESLERAKTFRESMASRRSVRDFSPEPIPDGVLEDAIACAAGAPSGANQQPWTFVVVTDPALKAKLREAAEAEERESYARRMSEEWLEALAPLGTDWHKPHFTDAPAIIVVFEQVYGVKPLPEGGVKKVKHYYVQESVGIAVGFLIAALTQAGLATLTHTPSPMGFLREVLGRPENERAFAVLPVGYPAPGARVPDIGKKPLHEVLVRR
ncbi:nitroreductase family protein [Myxococcus sp. RHSTA-1-4]|uniref:nitroreductase family protein n=1 Tax=Myxococcus sp. RHSTA-1-4 TaxID=2874601 RepID=UPI001CBC95C3|nr:nitroreductase family protein [Myxococcus sp. RHSTA-1-4]MBZ4417624.1 nitroreductase family protein [Myxococcus sp. RHSTA-1-4]